jgi:hypothetical protein
MGRSSRRGAVKEDKHKWSRWRGAAEGEQKKRISIRGADGEEQQKGSSRGKQMERSSRRGAEKEDKHKGSISY